MVGPDCSISNATTISCARLCHRQDEEQSDPPVDRGRDGGCPPQASEDRNRGIRPTAVPWEARRWPTRDARGIPRRRCRGKCVRRLIRWPTLIATLWRVPSWTAGFGGSSFAASGLSIVPAGFGGDAMEPPIATRSVGREQVAGPQTVAIIQQPADRCRQHSFEGSGGRIRPIARLRAAAPVFGQAAN